MAPERARQPPYLANRGGYLQPNSSQLVINYFHNRKFRLGLGKPVLTQVVSDLIPFRCDQQAYQLPFLTMVGLSLLKSNGTHKSTIGPRNIQNHLGSLPSLSVFKLYHNVSELIAEHFLRLLEIPINLLKLDAY